MNTDSKPDKNLVSFCGLFCKACGVYIATQENDHTKLESIAKMLGQTVDDTRCDGCRTDRRSGHCKSCSFIRCAKDRTIDFCGQCNDYPCEELKRFQSMAPHRNELWQSLERINHVGWEKWFVEMNDYYACSKCNTMNGYYNIKCRKCGAMPSSKFVENNLEALTNYKR